MGKNWNHNGEKIAKWGKIGTRMVKQLPNGKKTWNEMGKNWNQMGKKLKSDLAWCFHWQNIFNSLQTLKIVFAKIRVSDWSMMQTWKQMTIQSWNQMVKTLKHRSMKKIEKRFLIDFAVDGFLPNRLDSCHDDRASWCLFVWNRWNDACRRDQNLFS